MSNGASATGHRRFRSIGDAVREHAAADAMSTDDGIRFLELDRHVSAGAINGAANLYLSALSIIREQQKELAARSEIEPRGSYENGWNEAIERAALVTEDSMCGVRCNPDELAAQLRALKSPLVSGDLATQREIADRNQCDGCRRGLPTRVSDYGRTMHDGRDGMPVMICTAHLYAESATREPK